MDSQAKTDRFRTLWGVAAFVVIATSLLGSVERNFDEGVYIQQAKLISTGKLPFIDFFHHQSPLYIYILGGWIFMGFESFESCRLLSLLFTGTAAWMLADIPRSLGRSGAGPWIAVLFLFSPLTRFSLMAMPTGLMLFLAVAGFWSFFRGGRFLLLSAFFFAAALFAKPVVLPALLVPPILLLLQRRWRDLLLFISAGIVSCLVLGGAVWITSHGAFGELLRGQSARLSTVDAFQVMRTMPLFAEYLKARGISSVLEYNLVEHTRNFLTPFPFNPGLLYVLLAAAGALKLAMTEPRRLIFPGIWFILTFVFLLFFMKPSFDHYQVQYLPPLVLLVTEFLRPHEDGRWKIIALIVIAATIAYGAFWRMTNQVPVAQLRASFKPGEVAVALNPLLHAIARTNPVCDAIDPFNTYGDAVLSGISRAPAWEKFLISDTQIINCLKKYPDSRVYLHPVFYAFAQKTLSDFTENLAEERRVSEKKTAQRIP